MRRFILVLLLSIAALALGALVSAENVYVLEDYTLTEEYPLLLEMDYGSALWIYFNLQVSADDYVDVLLIKQDQFLKAVLGGNPESVLFHSSRRTMEFSTSATWSPTGISMDHNTYYFLIQTSANVAETVVDLNLTVWTNHDGDVNYDHRDPYPFDDYDLYWALQERVRALERAVTQLQADLDDINATLADHEWRLDKLEGNISIDVSALADDVEALEGDVAATQAALDAIRTEEETRATGFNESLLSMDEGLRRLSDENLDRALEEARSARNMGLMAGLVGIIVGVAAIGIASSARKKREG